jgi:hypothetical protein
MGVLERIVRRRHGGRRYACLATLGLLALPAAASATTTAQIFPSFGGGKPGGGTSMHFRFVTSDSAGGLPQLPTEAIIHLPKGTHIDLTRLLKGDLCTPNTLDAAGPSACPKGSHAGPVGFAHLEAPVGGHLTTVKATIYPVVVVLHGGSVGLALFMEAPAPFPTAFLVPLMPYTVGGSQELILNGFGALEVSPGVRSSMLDLSITLGANLKVRRGGRNVTQPLITRPGSCPKGGFMWSTNFTYWEGSPTTAMATSPCLR